MEQPIKIIQEQINSAINACEARILCGMDIKQAFSDLETEVSEILDGKILYED